MKAAPFEYLAPLSVEAAVEALAAGGDEAKVLAGGQSLMPMLALRMAQPALLVDLNRVGELAYLEPAPDGGLAIGSMTRIQELAGNRLIAERAPLAAEATPLISHRQIRNRSTVGGSLAHADPAAELPAVMLALEATLIARSASGERSIPAAEFFQTYFTTALAADEVLTEIRIPAPAPGSGWAVLEISRRSGDFALAGVAAMVVLDSGVCTEARIVAFGVSHAPVALKSAARILCGSVVTEERAREVAAAAAGALAPGSDIHASAAYRKRVAGVLVRRAVLCAAQRAAGSE